MPTVPFRASGPEPLRPGSAPVGFGTMWRWAAHLVPVGTPVTLGDGGTPLVRLDAPGLPGLILLKDERANPTGSFKDRLASATVSRARHLGADTVVVASSGNAGLAVEHLRQRGYHVVVGDCMDDDGVVTPPPGTGRPSSWRC